MSLSLSGVAVIAYGALIDVSLLIQISDFGLSKLIGTTGDGEVSATRVVGTYGYLAPE